MIAGEKPPVLTKRTDERHDEDYAYLNREATIAFTAETLRPKQAEVTKAEEKISVFWRVFGGTILSITALVLIQAYQSVTGSIHELRADQTRMRELAADFVKKDEFGSRNTSLWNRLQELQSLNAAVSVAGNRLTSLEQQTAAGEKDRKETAAALAAVTNLKERFAILEEQKKVSEQDHKEILAIAANLQALRDKDNLLEKLLRDAEAERKDLVRELQAFRERLAKFEGSQQSNSKGKSGEKDGPAGDGK
jgi:chromosome segregation ATPase